jgi:PIN domain
MNVAIVVIDTNLFLHCRPLNELPWLTTFGCERVELFVTPQVVSELDAHKSSPQKRKAEKARSAIAFLSSFRPANSAKDIIAGVSLTIQTPIKVEWDEFATLTKESKDDNLLAEVVTLARTKGTLTLMSGDLGLQLKAESLSITTRDIPDTWRLSNESDETAKELNRVNEELKRLKQRLPKLCLLIDNQRIDSAFELTPEVIVYEKPPPDWIQQQICSHLLANPKLATPGSNSRTILSSAPNFGVSDLEVQNEYEKRYSRFQEHTSSFFRTSLDESRNHMERLVPLSIGILNEGGAAAEHFELKIRALNGAALYDARAKRDVPAQMTPPRSPTMPSSVDLLSERMLRVPSHDFAFPVSRNRAATEVFWRSEPTEEASNELRLVCEQLRHDKEVHTGRLCVKLAEDLQTPTKIELKLSATNVREPTTIYLTLRPRVSRKTIPELNAD